MKGRLPEILLLWRVDPRQRLRIRVRFAAILALASFLPLRTDGPTDSSSQRRTDGASSRAAARSAFSRSLIVWNVGQGLWSTLSAPGLCWHFDMGGERAPWQAIGRECGSKQNLVSFSHWDADHVGFAVRAARALRGLCIAHRPQGKVPSGRKADLLSRLPPCPELPLAQDLSSPAQPRLLRARATARAPRGASNRSSRVFLADGLALIPGDSPQSEEAVWAGKIAGPTRPQILVLGHHGSRTSTGKELLKRLPGLRAAIASARKKRYGHPHDETAQRLRSAGVPLLETERWGNIRLELQVEAQAR